MSIEARMAHDEVLKLKAVALYVISKISPIDFHKLSKILYFADSDHYSRFGTRLIDDSFIAMKNGPVPSALYDAIKAAKGVRTEPWLREISDSLSVDGYYLTSIEHPDMDELSATDILSIEKSIKENSGLLFGRLSRKSHDIAWKAAWNGNGHIDPIMMARAAGSSEELIDYLTERKELEAILL